MRILILNQYFPPDTAATAKMAIQVVEALAQRHRITVLAGRPSYDPSERHKFYLLRREAHGNVVVERVGSTTYSRHRARGRLSNYLSYLALAVPRALTVPADIILSMTDPPMVGIAGALVAMLRRRPFVYNIRDLHPDMALASGIVGPARWVKLWDRLQCWALKRATLVIVLGEDMRDRVVTKGVDPAHIVIVRDGVAIPENLPAPDGNVAREVRCGFRTVLLHAGNLGFYGAWETLVDAARQLDGDGIGLVFVGDGVERNRIQEFANGCAKIRFLPFRPPEQVPEMLAAADLHVVTMRRGLEGLVVPSKLYPILAMGRPVLAVAPEESDVARIVRSTGCGVVVDPDNPAAVAEAVRRICADRALLESMGRSARRAASEFDREKHLDLFTRSVEGVISI